MLGRLFEAVRADDGVSRRDKCISTGRERPGSTKIGTPILWPTDARGSRYEKISGKSGRGKASSRDSRYSLKRYSKMFDGV